MRTSSCSKPHALWEDSDFLQIGCCLETFIWQKSYRPTHGHVLWHGLWGKTWEMIHSLLVSGKNTGVKSHFLFQGIFATRGPNLCLLQLLHWQWIFFFFKLLSHLGSLYWYIFRFQFFFLKVYYLFSPSYWIFLGYDTEVKLINLRKDSALSLVLKIIINIIKSYMLVCWTFF